jgi:hypothetical protein
MYILKELRESHFVNAESKGFTVTLISLQGSKQGVAAEQNRRDKEKKEEGGGVPARPGCKKRT